MMNKPKLTLKSSYFNALYGQNPDPWNFEQSEYEKQKYAKTLAILSRESYVSGLEIGCSNGVFSQLLQRKCCQLLAIDASSIAVNNAKQRLAPYLHVTVEEMEIPAAFPHDQFDLILFSEVGYFLVKDDLLLTLDKIHGALMPGGHLLMVHWTEPVEEFPLTGDEVHELFLKESGAHSRLTLTHLHTVREPLFRMDLFEKMS